MSVWIALLAAVAFLGLLAFLLIAAMGMAANHGGFGE